MPQRIDKIERIENPWAIGRTDQTDEDGQQNRGQDQGSQDAYSPLGEKTDWQVLFDKSRLWQHNVQVGRDEIQKIIFKKLNLKTDPSLLRIDIELNGGGKIAPAFLSISRLKALELKSLVENSELDPDLIFNEEVLSVSVPNHPELLSDLSEEKKAILPQANTKEVVAPVQKLASVADNDDDSDLTVKTKVSSIWISKDPSVLLAYGVAGFALFLILIGFFVLRALH